MRRETEENYILRANLSNPAEASNSSRLALRLMALFVIILVIAFVLSKVFPELLPAIPGS